MKMAENSSHDSQPLPFSDLLYLKAAMLDPSFGSMWIAHDVLVPDHTKANACQLSSCRIIAFMVNVKHMSLSDIDCIFSC